MAMISLSQRIRKPELRNQLPVYRRSSIASEYTGIDKIIFSCLANKIIKSMIWVSHSKLARDHPYIMSSYIFGLLILQPPTHLISINTVLNVSKTGHFLDPPTHSFCWHNIGMVPKHSFTEHWNFLKVCNVFWSKLQGLFFTFRIMKF